MSPHLVTMLVERGHVELLVQAASEQGERFCAQAAARELSRAAEVDRALGVLDPFIEGGGIGPAGRGLRSSSRRGGCSSEYPFSIPDIARPGGDLCVHADRNAEPTFLLEYFDPARPPRAGGYTGRAAATRAARTHRHRRHAEDRTDDGISPLGRFTALAPPAAAPPTSSRSASGHISQGVESGEAIVDHAVEAVLFGDGQRLLPAAAGLVGVAEMNMGPGQGF